MGNESGNFRKALCMGGVFAVSTVLPEKVQLLAYHLETITTALGQVESWSTYSKWWGVSWG